jgi:hypothetical protein
MPCWAELHPPFDASSPLGYGPQSHEILLNKSMEYWDCIKCTRLENIYSYSTHSNNDWLKMFEKRKDRANSV